MYNIRTVMADIYATRRARLHQLIEEKFGGNRTALARAVGFKPSYTARFTDIFGGRSNLGGRTAGRIEQALGLPEGWMDRKLPPSAVPKMPYKGHIGPRLKVRAHVVEELLSAGHSQRETAQQLGVHESTISRVVKKERRRTARTAA